MRILYLDESGDHNLTTIDPQYPMFVLGGVIVDEEYATGEMEAAVRRFKLELFGREDLILHTADIVRTKNGFEALKNTEFREYFYKRLNQLMTDLRYQVVACAIKKDDHLKRYEAAALDPYMLSLNVLVERFCYELGDVEHGGRIIAERRDDVLDAQLLLAWKNLTVQGTHYMKASKIRRRVRDIECHDKKENIAGLQLADLAVSPIGRFALGKPPKPDFLVIEGKLRRDWKGNYWGTGLVILPKNG